MSAGSVLRDRTTRPPALSTGTASGADRRFRRPDADGLRPPPVLEVAHEHEAVLPFAEALPRGVRDEHHVGRSLGHRLQARRDVRRVTDGGVLHALLGADVARHRLAGADPDPHAEAVMALV